jgi:hypothetical protein
MAGDPLKGKSLRWSYSDGPLKGKQFEHEFTHDGKVAWKMAGDAKPSADSSASYHFERINDGVYSFSYLSAHGYTLTTVVDERSGSIVSFASNEKELVVQHGRIEQK